MNFIERVKLLPSGTRRLLSIGVIMALVVALPLFIWAIVTGNFNLNKKAVSGEPGVCIPVNKTVTVTQEPIPDDGGCHDIQTAINSVTGDGYTVQIKPGVYNVYSTLNVNNKSNINITGDPTAGSGATDIHFISSGYGFNVTNSSGNINWLTMQGTTPNGMLSINTSNNFEVGYTFLSAANSHTVDIHNSNHISIYNSEISSSAGAVEVGTSDYISIKNTKIHNSANAISVYDSIYVSVGGNLIYGNRESALTLSNVQHFQAVNNTMTNNSYSVPQNGTVKISGNTGSDYSFYRNIISAGAGAGIQIVNGQTIGPFERNDIYGNNPNYSGYSNQTGINSNISADPLLDSNNFLYCPLSTSPVIFGDYVNDGSNGFMGYIGPCAGTSSPSPKPSPTPICIPLPECVYNPPIVNGRPVYCSPPAPREGTSYCPRPTPTATATPYATSTPYPTATPSPSPSGNISQSFTLRMKFAGVTDGSAEGAKVTLRFQNSPNFFDYVTSPITVTHTGNGVYQAVLTFGSAVPPLPANKYYAIYLKGEKHLATKFCQQTGQTTRCTGNGNISVPPATFNPASYVLEFTGLPLEPGDLYPQDGTVNSTDFTKIKDLLNKPCASLTVAEKLTGDLDYNGCVNVRDAFLMRQTLQTRYDEN